MKQYKGIAFIDKYFGYVHTQSFLSMVRELAEYCQRNGGYCLSGKFETNINSLSMEEMDILGQLAASQIEKHPELSAEQALEEVFKSISPNGTISTDR